MSSGRLYVCSMTKVVDTVRASGARSLVTILTAGASLVRPCGIPRERHLSIAVSDIETNTNGHILAGEEHIDRLLAFFEQWDQTDPLVIHCYAGVSRSPAAAYVAACALAPHRCEFEVARELRRGLGPLDLLDVDRGFLAGELGQLVPQLVHLGALLADHHARPPGVDRDGEIAALALFLFPWVGGMLHLTQPQFGLWAALAIHDTSSVVGATAKYGAIALGVGTTVKLARALWIVPLSGLTAVLLKSKARVQWPWFILLFCLAALANTLAPVLKPAFTTLSYLGRIGLTVTLFLIGTGLNKETLKKVGVRPLLQGLTLWILVGTGTLALILLNWIHI